MAWLLDINGQVSSFKFEEGFEELKRRIKEYIGQIKYSNNGLPYFVNKINVARYKVILKEYFDCLRGLTEESPSENLFDRIKDDSNNELTIYCKKNHDSNPFELFISDGQSYIHTNCFGYEGPSIYFFECYQKHGGPGFFNDSSEPLLIRFIDEENRRLIYELKNCLIDGKSNQYINYSRINVNRNPHRVDIDEIVNYGAPEIMGVIANNYAKGIRVGKDIGKAIILYQKCFEYTQKKVNHFVRPLLEDSAIEYCNRIAQLYFKLGRKQDYIDWLEKGSDLEGYSNICAYTLGQLCRKNRYVRYNPEKVIDYYKKAGDLGSIELARIYLLGECHQNIDYDTALCYYKNVDARSLTFEIGLCYLNKGDYELAHRTLGMSDYFDRSDFGITGSSLTKAALALVDNDAETWLDCLSDAYYFLFDKKITLERRWKRLFYELFYKVVHDFLNINMLNDQQYRQYRFYDAVCDIFNVSYNSNWSRGLQTLEEMFNNPNMNDLNVLELLKYVYIYYAHNEYLASQVEERINEITALNQNGR